MDDDPEVTVSAGDASASEGDAATFTVSLSAASGKLITVEYATSGGSAAAGADFASAGGTLAFYPGEREKTVSVATLEDALVEGDETFSFSLLRPANVVLADAQATGTIRDDDSASDPPAPPILLPHRTPPVERILGRPTSRPARVRIAPASVRARRASGRPITSSGSSSSRVRAIRTMTRFS